MAKTTTLSPHAIRAAVPMASNTAGRFALHAIRLEPSGRVVATDGRVLVAVESDEAVDGAGALSGPVLLHAGEAGAFAAQECKAGRRMGGMLVVDATAANANGHVPMKAVRAGLSTEMRKVEGAFPTFEDVIPKRAGTKVTLALSTLEALVASMKALVEKNGLTGATFYVPEARDNVTNSDGTPREANRISDSDREVCVRSAVRVEYSGHGHKATMVAMPIIGA